MDWFKHSFKIPLPSTESLKAIAVVGAFLCLITAYSYGAIAHAQRVNLNIDQGDQAAYISYAKSLYETDYNYIGRRNRMPIYPLLQSVVYDPSFTQNEYFTFGKYFNIALSIGLLPILFLLFKRGLPLISAINLWLISAFTVFIFKAGYFQAEILFYFLNFCSFLLMVQMLRRPTVVTAILTGTALALAHLTKASILPGLMLFVLFFIGQQGYQLWSHRQSNWGDRLKPLVKPMLSLLLTLILFLGILYPYISTSKRFFGRYFYNVNSTFYIWYDSWEEAEQGTQVYEDDKGWPQMPPDQIPSMSNYLKHHSALQIAERFIYGLKLVVGDMVQSYGYFKYFAIYLVISLALVFSHLRPNWERVKQHLGVVLFCISYFFSYLLLYAWYAPIASENRLILALFLPCMFVLSVMLVRQANQFPWMQIVHTRVKWFPLFNGFILGLILFELHTILSYRIVTAIAAS